MSLSSAGPTLVITEYCCFGDLLNFLRRKRECFVCFKRQEVEEEEDDCYYRNVIPQRDTARSVSFLFFAALTVVHVWVRKGSALVFTIQNVRRRGVFGQQRASVVRRRSAERRLLLSLSSQRQLERLHVHEAFCCWQSALRLVLGEKALATQRQGAAGSENDISSRKTHLSVIPTDLWPSSSDLTGSAYVETGSECEMFDEDCLSLDTEDLLSFSYQVAKGMEFLASKNVS